MANKRGNQSNDRSRVRFMLVDFEGSSADLHQLSQTFANAVKMPQPVIYNLPPAQPAAGLPPPATATQAPPQPTAPTLLDIVPDPEPPEMPVADRTTTKPASGQKRKYKQLKVVDGLELTSGPKPFEEYIKEVSPDEHSKRYLAIAQWLKEHRGIAEVGGNHVYTCYRLLNMTVPEDVLSHFRSLLKQGWVDKGSTPGLFKINHIGENQLTKAKNKS